MARNTRGGLGRGLSSLMGNSSNEKDQQTPNKTTQRTTNRERILYDEREEIYKTGEINIPNNVNDPNKKSSSPAITGQIDSLPQNTGQIRPLSQVNTSNEDQIVSRETIQQNSTSENQINVAEQNVIEEIPENQTGTLEVSIDLVEPNPDQPRSTFNQEELTELSNSIKQEGLIQPILVQKMDNDKYKIIAGERRYQASKLAGLTTVLINIKDVDDDKAFELALIENLQRSDLNPIEEALGYKRLMEKKRMTQSEIAQVVSKGRSTIGNALRLLELPKEAQQLLLDNEITAGHARAILSIPTKDGKESLTKKLEQEKLSVRDAENIARLLSNKPGPKTKKAPLPATYKSVAKTLREVLDTNVKIKSSKGKNKIEIEFTDEKDLERIFNEIVPED